MKMESIEAIITVGGVTLTPSQSMTVRVAICSFVSDLMEKGLGDDEHGKFMTKAYLENCRTIEKMIDESIQAQ